MPKIDCIHPTIPAEPQLPTGFSWAVVPPAWEYDIRLCCQIHIEDYLSEIPPIPWGGSVDMVTLATINGYLSTARKFIQDRLDRLVPECPKT